MSRVDVELEIPRLAALADIDHEREVINATADRAQITAHMAELQDQLGAVEPTKEGREFRGRGLVRNS